jgi:hypothetical protein
MFAALVLCIASILWQTLFARPTAAQEGTPTPTFSTTPLTITVKGAVTMGTAGESLPSPMTITLHLLKPTGDGQFEVNTTDVQADPTHAFRFEGVDVHPGTKVFVTVPYAGIPQGSAIVDVQNDTASMDLPVTLYAQSTASDGIVLERARYILDFERGDFMQVLATLTFQNTGDKFYLSADRDSAGSPVSLRVPLPIGARAIAFDPGLSTRLAVGGSAVAPIVTDKRPVLPGQKHEIVFSYQLPYRRGAEIDQDYVYRTTLVEILLPKDAGVLLTGDFSAADNATVNPQRVYVKYSLKTPLVAGQRLLYTLAGVPPVQAATPLPAQARVSGGGLDVPIIVLFAGVIILVGLASAALLMRGKGTPQP